MLASPPHLSQHQRTPSPPPLSSSCSSHRSAKLKSSNPCNHRNQQYSIIGLTNAAGTLVERYSYSAYGTLGIYDASGTVRTSSTYANRYTYTGREYDPDLNLYHFRARWYDPATGGFISRDPLGYVDGMSLYRGYLGAVHLDPTGQCTYSPGGQYSLCQIVRIKPEARVDKAAPSCGWARAAMRFEFVTRPSGKAVGLNGWIIQKVEYARDITFCCSTDPPEFEIPDDVCYYEAWKVVDGEVYIGDSEVKQENHYFDLLSSGDFQGTFGTNTVTGTVAFLKDYNLEYSSWGRAGQGNHPSQVTILPWRRCETGEPDGWSDAKKLTRKLVAEWDCCSDPKKETDVKDSEGWFDDCLDPMDF